MNVRDGEGTLILTWGQPKSGTLLTLKLAKSYQKPHFIVDMKQNLSANAVVLWIKRNNIKVLNIAGPRQSLGSFVYKDAYNFMKKFLILFANINFHHNSYHSRGA